VTVTAEGREPTIWVKLRLPSGGEIGPGKIHLLRNVREHRSIAAAARAMGMSYRRAWLLLEEIAASCGAPVVETFAGGKARGGASLTPLAERLVDLFDRIVAEANIGAAGSLKELQSILPAPPADRS
jgi:molybdate transport system regulatory protein